MSEQSNRAKIEAGLRAVNERNPDGFLQVVGMNYALYDVRHSEPLKGPHQVGELLEALFIAFPDLSMEPVQSQTGRHMAYLKVILRATHNGPLQMPDGSTVLATGKSIEVPIEMFHHFDAGGELISTVAYIDPATLAQQFGTKELGVCLASTPDLRDSNSQQHL